MPSICTAPSRRDPQEKGDAVFGGGPGPIEQPPAPQNWLHVPPHHASTRRFGGDFGGSVPLARLFMAKFCPQVPVRPFSPSKAPPWVPPPPKSVLTRVHDLHRSGYGGGNLSPSPSSTHPLPAHEGSPKSPPCCWPPEEGDGSPSGVAARTPQPPHTFFSAPPRGGAAGTGALSFYLLLQLRVRARGWVARGGCLHRSLQKKALFTPKMNPAPVLRGRGGREPN